MKLDKRLTDEVIELTRKFFGTYKIDYLRALNKAEEVLRRSGVPWEVVSLLYNLAHYTQESGRGTYDDIYRALAIFGITVEDKELENDK